MLLGSSTTQIRLGSRFSSRQIPQGSSSVMLLQTVQYRLLFLRSRMASAIPAASACDMPRTANARRSALFLPMPGSFMKASTIRPRALPDIFPSWSPAFSRLLLLTDTCDGVSCSFFISISDLLSMPQSTIRNPKSEHPRREPHAGGEFAHLFLHEVLRFSEGFVHRCSDQILEHLDVLRVDHRGVDLDRQDFLPPVGDDGHHPSAGRGFDGFPPRFFLEFFDPLLHLLGLFHDVAEHVFRHGKSWTNEIIKLLGMDILKEILRLCNKKFGVWGLWMHKKNKWVLLQAGLRRQA